MGNLAKSARLRAAAGVLVAVLAAVLFAGPRAVMAFDPDASSTPSVLERPLWSGMTSRAGGADVAMRIIRRSRRGGALRDVLGSQPPRLVRIGELQDRGRPVGETALLALPVARRDVQASVPGGRFAAHVLRDVLVDVDLRRGAIVDVEPGPASQTSTWPRPSPSPANAADAAWASPGAPALVRLSPRGPSFAPYDGSQALGPAGRDWPVSLVFAGHATIQKVKLALRTVGFTHSGERRWLAYRAPDGSPRFDSDRGVKTACDANGTDVHLRLYAPPRTDYFSDPRFGQFVVATVHFDRGEACTVPPQLFGFSEEAERRVGDVVARRLAWRVQRDRLPLGNLESYRRDLAVPDHLWWSDGRATLITVP